MTSSAPIEAQAAVKLPHSIVAQLEALGRLSGYSRDEAATLLLHRVLRDMWIPDPRNPKTSR